MNVITIEGASDDLIEIGGAIRDEFGYDGDREGGDRGDLLGFSDGTLLRIARDRDGIWRITRLRAGTATFVLEQADATDDGGTDNAALTGDIAWVVHGSSFASKKAR